MKPLKSGWAQSKQIRADLPSGAGNNAGLQYVWEHAAPRTITFAVGNLPPPSRPVACLATITFSVNGNHVIRQVSVVDGMAISGFAEGITVVLENVLTGLAATDDTYVVTATVAPGIRPTTSISPFLYFRDDIKTVVGGPTTVTVPVPQGVGVRGVKVMLAKVAGAALFYDDVIVTLDDTSPAAPVYYPLLDWGYVPILPGTALIGLTVLSASTVRLTPIFSIDG